MSLEKTPPASPRYVGRLAPSPTGYLHLGHARTFWHAAERSRTAGGTLLMRNDDLDRVRCRPEFAGAMLEDLRWLGFSWREPVYSQSGRISLYREALERLHEAGLIYPCNRSRRDVAGAAGAPHEDGAQDDEPVFPREWRPPSGAKIPALPSRAEPVTTNWRYRVPDGEAVTFFDNALGPQSAVAGRDFGDFIVWRRDDMPSYQLACAVDDIALGVTEVVRGADLVRSTFRQILLMRALGANTPQYFHCPLMADENGRRLAKRHDALALRTLRERGVSPEALLRQFHADAKAG
ncbi:glutamyl/glutaminyl-tRNA synthetase [Ereboglobus sp. PH5-5]|uniref:tRNA glutamyl-Q(34) synthetase GluQRS n=1 Tax=Ereboglobus sp. PH5-5 TaxID=2940529 RepID=UPI002405CD07|nr:tRNA glutamyl-Q(34) synthetase GluQRS [Ereboglobus sp. PH5-5]MDF9832025.1 glutamyl/glutaminyl-tRNA synthetase [Ereboglobus sp. PH5-5]